MRGPWQSLAKPEMVRIIAPDGTERCEVQAYFAGNMFVIEDMKADLAPGDELRRLLPNGKDEAFRVDDPQFFDTGGFPAHYQVMVSRKGMFDHNTGGHFISVSGPNSRVNINSTDKSTNVSNAGDVFGEMRQAIESGVQDAAQRSDILAAIDEAKAAKGTNGFVSAYQKVISVSADHIGLLAPFLPALTSMLPS